jgi:hypothetical protein
LYNTAYAGILIGLILLISPVVVWLVYYTFITSSDFFEITPKLSMECANNLIRQTRGEYLYEKNH